MEAVIATILLLLMTVAAAGALYFWAARSQQDVSTSADVGMRKQSEQTSFKLGIDGIWNTTTQLCISVRNRGLSQFSELDVNDTGIFINDNFIDWDRSTSRALAEGDYITMCLCNGTATVGCPITSTIFRYMSEGSEYPTVAVMISPIRGNGEIRNYQFKQLR